MNYQRIMKILKDRLKQSNFANNNLKAEISLARGEIDLKQHLIDHLRMIIKQVIMPYNSCCRLRNTYFLSRMVQMLYLCNVW